MIRDVLVHVDATASGRERLNYAFDLADRHGARLTGLHVIAPVDVPPYFRPSAVEREAAVLERRAKREAAASETVFRAVAETRATPARWSTLRGGMAHRLCERAAYADLVILGQYEAEGSAERHPLYLAEEVVLAAGCPVLVTPQQIGATAQLCRVLVGWDGGHEAARALRDCLPLLVAAGSTIEILIADERGTPNGAAELIDHLSRHGIAVDPARHVHHPGSAGPALLQRLGDRAFDLLVIGAFGHPAWLEVLFGGATREAVMRAETPVFFSH
ncbi:MAG TPA: universal stress protein [Phenylobacterium sp.]|nr:universal stress protein [Phenylobacterium sp.]